MLKGNAPLRRVLAALALTALLVPAMAGSAGAVSPLPIACTAAGTVTFTNGDPDRWLLVGQGSCQGDLEGTYVMSLIGVGTSDTLGLCDEGLIVQNLNILTRVSLRNLANSANNKTLLQLWTAPVTTYPVVTPFLIVDLASGTPNGAGAFFNHIFLMCTGPTVAQFSFAFLT
jgi:hypothetical protein